MIPEISENKVPKDREFFFNVVNTHFDGQITKSVNKSYAQRNTKSKIS